MKKIFINSISLPFNILTGRLYKKTIFKRRHLTKRCLGDSHNCLVLILGRQQISGYGR